MVKLWFIIAIGIGFTSNATTFASAQIEYSSGDRILVQFKDDKSEVWYQSANGSRARVDTGRVLFLSASMPEFGSSLPPEVNFFDSLGKGFRPLTESESDVHGCLIGINDYVLWIQDNGKVVKLSVDPSTVDDLRVIYPLRLEPDNPKSIVGSALREKDYASIALGTGKTVHAYLIRDEDGASLSFGPVGRSTGSSMLHKEYFEVDTHYDGKFHELGFVFKEFFLGIKVKIDLESFSAENQKPLPAFMEIANASRKKRLHIKDPIVSNFSEWLNRPAGADFISQYFSLRPDTSLLHSVRLDWAYENDPEIEKLTRSVLSSGFMTVKLAKFFTDDKIAAGKRLAVASALTSSASLFPDGNFSADEAPKIFRQYLQRREGTIINPNAPPGTPAYDAMSTLKPTELMIYGYLLARKSNPDTLTALKLLRFAKVQEPKSRSIALAYALVWAANAESEIAKRGKTATGAEATIVVQDWDENMVHFYEMLEQVATDRNLNDDITPEAVEFVKHSLFGIRERANTELEVRNLFLNEIQMALAPTCSQLFQ